MRGWQEGAGRRKEDAGEAESQLPAQALTQETPPQDRTLQVSHTEPQGPDILPLPEHLQFNRKQRSDSPVAEFQLSLEGAERRVEGGGGGGCLEVLGSHPSLMERTFTCDHHARPGGTPTAT